MIRPEMTPIRFLLVIVLPLAACAKWGFGGLVAGVVIGGLIVAWMIAKDDRIKRERRCELEKLLVVPPPPQSPAASSWDSPPTNFWQSDMDSEIRENLDVGPPPLPPPLSVPQSRTSIWDRMAGLSEVVTATRPPQAKKLEWITPGTQIQIGGRLIPGMVYLSDVAMGWGSEPSAICRPQQVARTAVGMEDLPYFPSYESISPNQRAIYLDWLARGRRDADPDSLATGYLFLFFYGIERRVLVDGDRDLAIWNEVLNLLHLYGLTRKSWSVASYFGDFLHYTAYAMGPERYSEVCPSLLAAQGKRISETAMTLALANHFRMGRPVEWDVAHLIAMNLEESRRSVVTERTGDAFKKMFRNRFETEYPTGLALKASKRNQRVQYRSGNNTLSIGAHTGAPRSSGAWPPGFVIEVPGVMGIKSQFKTLSSIWNQCIEDLSGYSRAVSRISSAQSITNQDLMKAYLSLPIEIRKDHQHPLADEFDQFIQTCPEIETIRFVPVSVLSGLLGIGERPNLTASQSDDVAELLESLGFTLAPHPRLLNFPLSWSQEIGVARCSEPAADEARLGGLLRLLFLAVLVASADGEVDQNELQVFHRTNGVTDEFGRIQIAATEAALLRDTHVATRLLPRIAKSVPKLDRMGVFKLLVHIASCDDVISSDENRMLRKIAKALELGDTALDDVLTDNSAFHTVTVARGRSGTKGETIPGRRAEVPVPAFSLDMDRIAALTKETAEVVSILSKALAEEEHEEHLDPPVPVAKPEQTELRCPEWAESLDQRYQPALAEILSLPDEGWLDLAAVAIRHHLMKDDLIDGLNSWSDEFLGDFLFDNADDGGTTLRRDLIPSI